MKSDRKPPIVKSPLRLGPRRTLRSGASTTPMTTTTTPTTVKPMDARVSARFGWNTKQQHQQESELGELKYNNMSTEFNALSKFVHEELGKSCSATVTNGFGSASVFERGRLYDVYSTRRNERLKRRIDGGGCDWTETSNTAVKLTTAGVGYKRGTTPPRKKEMRVDVSVKKPSSAMRSKNQSSAYTVSGRTTTTKMMIDRSEHPRYALRSIKKPPLPVPMSVEYSAAGMRKTRGVRVRKN